VFEVSKTLLLILDVKKNIILYRENIYHISKTKCFREEIIFFHAKPNFASGVKLKVRCSKPI